MHEFFKTKQFLLIFLILVSIVVPTGETAIAHASNQMISDEYLQNQNKDDQDTTEEGEPVQDNEQENGKLATGEGLNLWDYMKMLFALLFVLGLLMFVLKFINKRSLNYQQNSLVRNIGGVSLGAQKSVQLIQIGKSIYVVGVGEDVQLIKEIDSPEDVEQIINNFNEKQSFTSTTPYIAELVKKVTSKLKNSEVTEQQQKSFGEIFNHKLADIKKNRQNELEKWKEKERDK
ncbi:flagellar biosynthetic protein FliO [Ureibacillus sp. MALMAid1270]|uniref:flagellar biosynthetic protein FliO n=1 Tax=Ureibacillus sp. MALMAid1270 TaxID=3411629 RepID=UPI003BA4E910